MQMIGMVYPWVKYPYMFSDGMAQGRGYFTDDWPCAWPHQTYFLLTWQLISSGHCQSCLSRRLLSHFVLWGWINIFCTELFPSCKAVRLDWLCPKCSVCPDILHVKQPGLLHSKAARGQTDRGSMDQTLWWMSEVWPASPQPEMWSLNHRSLPGFMSSSLRAMNLTLTADIRHGVTPALTSLIRVQHPSADLVKYGYLYHHSATFFSNPPPPPPFF